MKQISLRTETTNDDAYLKCFLGLRKIRRWAPTSWSFIIRSGSPEYQQIGH